MWWDDMTQEIVQLLSGNTELASANLTVNWWDELAIEIADVLRDLSSPLPPANINAMTLALNDLQDEVQRLTH